MHFVAVYKLINTPQSHMKTRLFFSPFNYIYAISKSGFNQFFLHQLTDNLHGIFKCCTFNYYIDNLGIKPISLATRSNVSSGVEVGNYNEDK